MSVWTSLCEWFEPLGEMLWLNALVIVPLAILAAIISSIPRLRPATRHGAWLVALAWCLLPPVLPAFRVQIDDHTTHTPLSVPHSADSERVASPLLSVGSVPRFDVNPVSESAAIDPAETLSVPIRSHSRLVAADWKSPKPPRRNKATSYAAPAADKLSVARRESLERGVGGHVESPLLWEPDGDVAFYPAASVGDGVQGSFDARDVIVASEDFDQRGKSIERAESQRQGGSNAHDGIDGDLWRDHWLVRPLAVWVQGLLEVRDAIGRLPAMPAQIWLMGMLLTALTFGALAADCRRRLRGAYPAPAEVCELVRFAADRMGLARAPRVMLVDRRMSPMIWCGRPPTLVLPADLWDELDDSARHAVIFHELAHLLRRDHWVCRLSIAATCLYWWHPLVWWVRKRVHEEAEMCCDAWVIWHLPSGRRAYANTLLRARRYLSCPPSLTPALAMGAANSEKQKFARRLTMIMTQRFKPHRGSASVVLLAALCLAGWAATPAISSPPAAPTGVSAPSAPTGVTVLAAGPTPPMVALAPLAPLAAAPPGPNDGDKDAKSDRELRQRMIELQRQVEQLSRKVEKLAESAERSGRIGTGRPPRIGRGGDVPFGLAPATRGNLFTRKYSLPEGKLEAFVHLMARDDVPILISPGDDDVEVQGSAAQHAIIESFVAMINRERKEETQAYELSEGKLQDLTELMIRDDVPIRVRPGDEKIGVIGTPAEQAIFKAFVDLIRPDTRNVDNPGAFRDAQRAFRFAQGKPQEQIEAARLQIEESLERAQAYQNQRLEEAHHVYAESLMNAKEHQQQRLEEAKRAYQEAMEQLEKELARQKKENAQ